jgi:hypothetical protein
MHRKLQPPAFSKQSLHTIEPNGCLTLKLRLLTTKNEKQPEFVFRLQRW